MVLLPGGAVGVTVLLSPAELLLPPFAGAPQAFDWEPLPNAPALMPHVATAALPESLAVETGSLDPDVEPAGLLPPFVGAQAFD